MHQVAVMAAGEGFRVAGVRCAGAPRVSTLPELERGHQLVAARRGAFLRRAAGSEILIDGTARLPQRARAGRAVRSPGTRR